MNTVGQEQVAAGSVSRNVVEISGVQEAAQAPQALVQGKLVLRAAEQVVQVPRPQVVEKVVQVPVEVPQVQYIDRATARWRRGDAWCGRAAEAEGT